MWLNPARRPFDLALVPKDAWLKHRVETHGLQWSWDKQQREQLGVDENMNYTGLLTCLVLIGSHKLFTPYVSRTGEEEWWWRALDRPLDAIFCCIEDVWVPAQPLRCAARVGNDAARGPVFLHSGGRESLKSVEKHVGSVCRLWLPYRILVHPGMEFTNPAGATCSAEQLFNVIAATYGLGSCVDEHGYCILQALTVPLPLEQLIRRRQWESCVLLHRWQIAAYLWRDFHLEQLQEFLEATVNHNSQLGE